MKFAYGLLVTGLLAMPLWGADDKAPPPPTKLSVPTDQTEVPAVKPKPPAPPEEPLPPQPDQPRQVQIDDFKAELKEAWESKDPAKLKELYYFKGTPEAIQQQEIAMLRRNASAVEFKQAEYLPLNDYYRKMGSAFRKLFEISQEISYNGLTRRMNLPACGFMEIHVVMPRRGNQPTSTFVPVGITPEGKLKQVALTVDGEREFKALPPYAEPVKVQPLQNMDEIDAFREEVKAAFTSDDWRSYMKLYDMHGANQADIDKLAEQFAVIKAGEEKGGFELVFENSTYRPIPDVMRDEVRGKANQPILGVLFVYQKPSNNPMPQTSQFFICRNDKGELRFAVPKLEQR